MYNVLTDHWSCNDPVSCFFLGSPNNTWILLLFLIFFIAISLGILFLHSLAFKKLGRAKKLSPREGFKNVRGSRNFGPVRKFCPDSGRGQKIDPDANFTFDLQKWTIVEAENERKF